MIIYIIPFLLLISPALQAEPISISNNIEEFLETEFHETDSVGTLDACRVEEKYQIFPKNCLLHLERLLLEPHRAKSFSQLFVAVSRLCVSQTHQLQSQASVNQILNITSLSSQCRQSLLGHREDLQYQQGQRGWHIP